MNSITDIFDKYALKQVQIQILLSSSVPNLNANGSNPVTLSIRSPIVSTAALYKVVFGADVVVAPVVATSII